MRDSALIPKDGAAMLEVFLNIKVNFETIPEAKDALAKLEELLKKHNNDLNQVLNSIKKFKPEYLDVELEVTEIKRSSNAINIKVTTEDIDPPVWFGGALSKLGAFKTFVREEMGGDRKNYYILGGKRVTKRRYDAFKPKSLMSEKDKEINKNLFLPDGRVTVKASLVDFKWSEGYFGDFCTINMLTESGMPIVYKGGSEAMVKLTKDEYENECEFSATFERQRDFDNYISVVKRPTKVVVKKKEE